MQVREQRQMSGHQACERRRAELAGGVIDEAIERVVQVGRQPLDRRGGGGSWRRPRDRRRVGPAGGRSPCVPKTCHACQCFTVRSGT